MYENISCSASLEELVNDYGLRHRDMTTLRLEQYGTMIGVGFHWDGVMLFPLPCVGKVCFLSGFKFYITLYVLLFC